MPWKQGEAGGRLIDTEKRENEQNACQARLEGMTMRWISAAWHVLLGMFYAHLEWSWVRSDDKHLLCHGDALVRGLVSEGEG